MKPAESDKFRMEYDKAELLDSGLKPHPMAMFKMWFDEAVKSEFLPDAMTLATVSPEGTPHARILLLKGFDDEGFTFFSNKKSQKGMDLKVRPHATIMFWWAKAQRQVRIEGPVADVSDKEADEYFASRPRGSQLSAWASEQSEPIASREILEKRVLELEHRFEGGPIPRPPYWGGYRLLANTVEFWQGRPGRLHDRFRYHQLPDDEWAVERLCP